MAYTKKLTHLPPGCGEDLQVPLLYNPYQQQFQEARRLRFCLNCKTVGNMDTAGRFLCAKCSTLHTSNLTAPRQFDRFLVLAGRGGGKTLIGAHAAREEMMVPNSIGWVMGPSYKILHDSTFPTLIRLIPPEWVEHWDADHMELRLKNKSLVAFRSLEDADRARGPHGVGWGWFDEAAQSPERAYDVFEPTLIKAGGIIICTTTVLGYDWTYDRIEKKAVAKAPGFWSIRYWTEENPLFASNPVMKMQIERAKATMPPDFYAQEYRAERRNAQGLIYNYQQIEDAFLPDDAAIRKHIPEWPNIDPSRKVLIGMDSGADHPFGAVLIVVTPTGLVVVAEYLHRMRALSDHRPAIIDRFGAHRFSEITWAANKNEAQLRLEFALADINIVSAESKQEVGIQRVSTWLHTTQLFIAYTCPLTKEQMQSYRYAENYATDGQKKLKEAVFKKNDELPDAIRYALMAWPELPAALTNPLTAREQSRWSAMDERTRLDVERQRAYVAREREKDLTEKDTDWPLGDFFGQGAYLID